MIFVRFCMCTYALGFGRQLPGMARLFYMRVEADRETDCIGAFLLHGTDE
jgi:hypothetical protein